MKTPIARAMMTLATVCMEEKHREWGLAMQAELEEAIDAGKPLRFAFGCLVVALRRMHGIDAPELSQTCARAGKPWACGRDAASKLAQLVTGQQVRCEQRDMDDYGRIVATCRAGSIDLSAAMVDAGLAVALSHFSTFYVGNEARARERRLGIWDSDFQQPAEYRAANPARKSREPSPAIPRQSFASPSRSTTYYRNCSDARAAGAAPLYRGQPGYRIEMDGDGDGIACEPYRARP